MRGKHRAGHRYKGRISFSFDDGSVEETLLESKETKGLDGFMVNVIEAVLEVGGNPMSKGSDVAISYEGDFTRDVKELLQKLHELGRDPEKQKDFDKYVKRYMELRKKMEGEKS